ncbi:hypothetical protein JI735_33580 [Paenibacillus sonchi]|uniref:Uncharacterized protein n=1 Tax=Paenibacillus sonchi TaxID=373687 RepID=A0A974SCA7_9BACL|nr:hypothetical protein [Paenibacillus sonchi]QQZ61243.1 hypothetical protein JI735_33580 [Paenibacillus sonchi]
MLPKLNLSSLPLWLENDVSSSENGRYKHNLLRENPDVRPTVLEDLKTLVQKSHDDARYRLRSFLEDNLDPLDEWKDEIDPAEGYPHFFDLTTLKGYFGEFFSGLIAENLTLFDEAHWKVPVFSFRWHDTAFDQLEMMRQTGNMKGAIFGRTGDDCVAFVMEKGIIKKILFLEAKCSAAYDMGMINDAHVKISTKNLAPLEIRRLIEILQDYESNPDAGVWIQALRGLYREYKNVDRYDCVSYICGQFPKRPTERVCWMPRLEPHPSYKGERMLEVAEIHINDVNKLVSFVYGKEE